MAFWCVQGPRNTLYFYFYFSYFTSRDGASRGASCCEQMFLKHFQKYHIGLRGSIIVNLSNIGRCCEATKNTGKTYNENDDICFSLFIHIYCTVWLMRSKNTLLYFKKFAVTLLHKLWFLSLFVVFLWQFLHLPFLCSMCNSGGFSAWCFATPKKIRDWEARSNWVAREINEDTIL